MKLSCSYLTASFKTITSLGSFLKTFIFWDSFYIVLQQGGGPEKKQASLCSDKVPGGGDNIAGS
jgi:hypothetical protein